LGKENELQLQFTDKLGEAQGFISRGGAAARSEHNEK
jgi:hypothetical protein